MDDVAGADRSESTAAPGRDPINRIEDREAMGARAE